MVKSSENFYKGKIEIIVKNSENEKSLTRHNETHEDSHITYNGDWVLVHTYKDTDDSCVITPYNLKSIVKIKITDKPPIKQVLC